MGGGGRGGGSPEVRAEARFTGRGRERRELQGRVGEQQREREYGEYGRREERREEYAHEQAHERRVLLWQ